MTLHILHVAYALATVGPDAVGGAEQILARLDHAACEAGHQSIVIACAGSRVSGRLCATPVVDGPFTASVVSGARAAHRAAIASALATWRVDVVHMHGLDFNEYLPRTPVPVLATLHLPPAWYSPAVFALERPHTFLNCVSWSQRARCPDGCTTPMLPPIANGVSIEPTIDARRGELVVALGRICPEKGYEHALDAARLAGAPLILAGRVFPYEAHEAYFRREIVPRLDARRRFVGVVGTARKRRLLASARCLLVPSLAPETSSLVAMESLAVGTPVVAFDSGALAEIVEHGRTGFLVRNVREMADAIRAVDTLDRSLCRQRARERFAAERMAAQYLEWYELLSRGETPTMTPTDAAA